MSIQKIGLLLAACLLLSCSNAQKKLETDWSKEGLMGAVKSMTTTQYKPLSEAATVGTTENLGLLQEDTRLYDEAGFCIEMRHKSRGGKIQTKRVLVYNDLHWLTNETHYKGTVKEPVLTNVFEYDKEGDLQKQTYTGQGQGPVSTVYTYSEDKTLRNGQVKTEKGIVQSTYETFFDASGNITKDIRFNKDGESMAYAMHHRYDSEERLYCTEIYNPVGNNFSVSKFNKEGQKIEVRKYRDGLITSACRYAYDEKGNEQEVSCDINEAGVKRVVKSTMQYEYDEQGNWIRKTTLQEGVVTYVVERALEYYEK